MTVDGQESGLRVWDDEMQWRHSARCMFERGGDACDCGLARFRAALTRATPEPGGGS